LCAWDWRAAVVALVVGNVLSLTLMMAADRADRKMGAK
jgi:hypothetical protein